MANAVEATDLVKSYPKKITLYNFSLAVPEGSVFGLLGPNGAGKSTFIRILGGLEKEDSGSISVFGKRVGPEQVKKIGIAPQENSFYPLLTCMENLLYFGSLYGVQEDKAKERALQFLALLGLEDKTNIISSFLSGGMKRRLNLACALMHSPKIIVLDEPTTGLDPLTRKQLWETVKAIADRTKATVVLTTHYLEEAEALCDRVAFVSKGQVVATGTPDELKRRVGRELIKARTVPGDYRKLADKVKKLKNAEAVTITGNGLVIEAAGAERLLEDITGIIEKSGERIVELSVSKPSLEDVFLKITGSRLHEATQKEAVKDENNG